MDTALKILKMIFLASVALLCLTLCVLSNELRIAHTALVQLNTDLVKLGTDLDGLKTTTDTINKQWIGKTGQLQTVLRSVNYTLDVAGTTSKKESLMLDTWNNEITKTFQNVNDLVVNTSKQTTSMVNTVNNTVGHVNPVLDEAVVMIKKSEVSIDNVNTLTGNPDIPVVLSNVKNVTASAAGITEDAHKVADKATADYLKPVPWYMQPVKKGGELIDIGAAVARHTP
ncbi:MAG TPA: hypothetical protein VIY48_00805 [Candidatus Paceibacterota bacterium]